MATIQQVNKKFAEKFEAVQVETLEDVKRVLANFDATGTKQVEFKVTIEGEDIDGKSGDARLYDMLVAGFDKVKSRREALTKMLEGYNSAVRAGNADELDEKRWDTDFIRFEVDNLIKNRLGGIRKGLRVRWELKEGIFELDPYTKKVFKVDA